MTIERILQELLQLPDSHLEGGALDQWAEANGVDIETLLSGADEPEDVPHLAPDDEGG